MSDEGWVDVDDGLPEVGLDVYVRRPATIGPVRTVARLDDRGYWLERFGEAMLRYHGSVTHWKPIPPDESEEATDGR